MSGKDEDVSQFFKQRSPMNEENSTMSAEADVAEMQRYCGEIASRTAQSGEWKDRITAVSGALSVGWNRAYELLRGKARRVDGWEKDNARRVLDELRAAERHRRELEHLAWLESEIARHRASGEELRGPHVDGLEHFLRLARGADSAVAVPAAETSEDGGVK